MAIERLTIRLIGESGPIPVALLLRCPIVLCTVVRLIMVGMLAKLRTSISVGWQVTLWLVRVPPSYFVSVRTLLLAIEPLLR